MNASMKYARACLEQGMTYAVAARASGIAETDLRGSMPGFGRRSSPLPESVAHKRFTDIAGHLEHFSESDLKSTMALCMNLYASHAGLSALRGTANNVIGAIAATGMSHEIHPTGQKVAKYVASVYGLTWDEMIGQGRTYNLSRPRQAAYYLMRTICPHLSFPAIGKIIGGRDHTTVLHGYRKVIARMDRDDDYKHHVEMLAAMIVDRYPAKRQG